MLAKNEKPYLGGYKDDLDTNEKVMIAIVKASEFFKKDSDTIFKNYGLTFSQYNALRVLNNSQDGRNSVTNVSKIMIVSTPNMTGITKRLAKNGFIIRGKNDESDERVTLLEITPKGKLVLKNISKAKDKNIQNYLESFSGERKKSLLEDLRQIFNKSTHQNPGLV